MTKKKMLGEVHIDITDKGIEGDDSYIMTVSCACFDERYELVIQGLSDLVTKTLKSSHEKEGLDNG